MNAVRFEYVLPVELSRFPTGNVHVVRARSVVRGRIWFAEDMPFAHVEVALVDEAGSDLAVSTTDDEGFYEFEGTFDDAAAVRCHEVEDLPPRGIAVQLIDLDGLTQLADREVELFELGEPRTVLTDHDGCLILDDLTDAFYTLRVGKHVVVVPTEPANALPDPPTLLMLGRTSARPDQESLDYDSFEASDEGEHEGLFDDDDG